MSVAAYDNPDKFPGANAIITAPPSLASANTSSDDGTLSVSTAAAQNTPPLDAAPWVTALPGSTLTISASTGGNTGDFEVDEALAPSTVALTTTPGNGTGVAWQCTPTGRSGLNDLALRLQNGYSDANSDPIAAVPSTIIGGVIITEAAPGNDTIAPY